MSNSNTNELLKPNQITTFIYEGQTFYIWNGEHFTKEQLQEKLDNLKLLASACIHKGFDDFTQETADIDKRLISLAKILEKQINELMLTLSLTSPPVN